MRTFMAGLTVIAGSTIFGLGAAGAQVAEQCPESPQVCPPEVRDQTPIVREQPPATPGQPGGPDQPATAPDRPTTAPDEPEVLGEGQVRPTPGDDVDVEAATPRRAAEVAAAQGSGGLPVTGADTMVLVAAGAALVAGGGGLVLRSKRADAGVR